MRALALSLAFVCLAPAAHAWAPDGHRIACTIAWDEMTEPLRERVGGLLDISTKQEFAEVCAAADTFATHHVVFVPKDARAIDMARDCPNGACALGEIERGQAVLKSGAQKTEKARALKTVSHLVADLHQPLNIGFAEDGGGASIRGTFRSAPVTLRDLWEQELVATILNPNAANGFLTVYGFMSVEGRAPRLGASAPMDWANESLWIMRAPATGYLGNPGGLDYDDTYVRQNRRVALEQLDKAGVRLAALLAAALQ